MQSRPRRPYGWREQLAVGLAILVFVVGAPWAMFELSRRPLLARAAAIGERICRLAVEGKLGPRDSAVKVPGITVLGVGQSARLIGMAEALKDDCYYAVRETHLKRNRHVTHILTIAEYPLCDTSRTTLDLSRNVISLRISYHLFWTPLFHALNAIFLNHPFTFEFFDTGYTSGGPQYGQCHGPDPSVLWTHGRVSGK